MIPSSKRRSGMHVAAAVAIAMVLVVPGTGARQTSHTSRARRPDGSAQPTPLTLTDRHLHAPVDVMSHGDPAGDGIATDGDPAQVELLYSGGHDTALAA